MPEQTLLSPADHIEIQQLYAKYCFALDTGDGPGRAAVFTTDGTFTADITGYQPDPVQGMVARTNRTGNKGSRHLIMNIVLTPTPEGAAGRAYALILGDGEHDAHGDRDLRGKSGFYVDTLVRTPAGWRFRTREFWRDCDAGSPFRRGAPPAPMPWR